MPHILDAVPDHQVAELVELAIRADRAGIFARLASGFLGRCWSSFSGLGIGGRRPVAPLRGETERQVGPLECTSARKADSGTHGSGAGKILKKIQAWLSIR